MDYGIDKTSPLNIVREFDAESTVRATDNFQNVLANELAEVNNQIKTSEIELRKLAVGETDNLHHVMMSLEKAKTSFELVLQVRNKVLEGYQEIMRMQV